MPVLIQSVEPASYAARAGIRPGDTLLAVDRHPIADVLDYRFYVTSRRITLELLRAGKPFTARISKGEYDDIGLEFETYLMDRQHTCKNKCVFCFVDQMPPGMRDSLYFKDDDSRMSFLFGNYITLTNLTDADIDRIIKMRISPVNISVHTTDPALRVQLMKNPHAAGSLRYIGRLTGAGIRVNAQLVLCPGLNDGAALERTLCDLDALGPNLQSIACVPVGLTKYRDGLPALKPFTSEGAARTIDILERFAARQIARGAARTAYPSDEFFLIAGRPLPDVEYYGDFDQLDNGVGLLTLLESEFSSALALDGEDAAPASATLATGVAAAPLLKRLAARAMQRHPGVTVDVRPIVNRFFGETITVAGLITGRDLIGQLGGAPIGGRLLIPSVMLRHERDRFLDDVTADEVERTLGVRLCAVDNDGYALYDAMTGRG